MKRRIRLDGWTTVALAVFVFYTVALLIPLGGLLLSAFKDSNSGSFTTKYFARFFGKSFYLETIWNSLAVSVSVTLLSVLIATPLAYIVATISIKGTSVVRSLMLVSSMSAPFIGAYSWILLLGNNGTITGFLRRMGIRVPSIYGFPGIVLVLTLQLSPMVFMYVLGAMKNVDSSLLDAAESLGYQGVQKVLKVVAPLIMPTVLAGGLMAFMRALADFGTPMLIGQGYRTVPVLIYTEFISEMGGDTGFAAAVSIVIVALAVIVFFAQRYVSNRMSYEMNALHPIVPAKARTALGRVMAHVAVYLFTAFTMIPQLYVAYTSFKNTSGRVFTRGFSLNSYRQTLDEAGSAIKNTMLFSLIAVSIIVVIAVLSAYVMVRRRSGLTGWLDVILMLPFIVPGSVMGIALLTFFNHGPIVIAGTSIIIVLAFVIRRLPYTVRSAEATLRNTSVSVEEAAISLGASPARTFVRITVPMILSGIISGAILSWISIITELSATVLLYTTKTRTMSIAIYSEVLSGNYGVAAALSTMLTVLTVFLLFLFYKISGSRDINI
ncbi:MULTISPECIES: ABC transporter permease [Bifidobacterium]|uniref:Iron ABC transporter permease n=1 Tax=Bifidobacterium asteroides TaxID=1684 RepID=A0A318MLP6_9BIFI|nr:iron ABC transporter permease [Bifidobacterium asteroides]MCP8614735.1 iron ABC transporter permease [Bifidobacterium asteroides]PXY89539.1 iron ABC transporter permease [Bifidobacterium asteroides]